MSQSSQDAPWNLFGSLRTEYSFLVNCISFVCLGFALMFLVPLAVLIVLDIFVWLWRMYRSPDESCDMKPAGPQTTDSKPNGISTGLDSSTLRL